MDWPDESASPDSPTAWTPTPSVPWASAPQPSAVFDPASTAPDDFDLAAEKFDRLDSPPIHLPFAQNGAPMPEGREAVASFRPDGSHDAAAGWADPDRAPRMASADGTTMFTPQPLGVRPPAPEAAPPVELQLVHGNMPVIPDWEPGIPVPLREEPKTDSCLPTADYTAESVDAFSEPTAEPSFTWDQVLTPAASPTQDFEHQEIEAADLPGLAAERLKSAEPAGEPVKSTPPPAWGAPAWGRPRLAKAPEEVASTAGNESVDSASPIPEAQEEPEVLHPAPFAWPSVEPSRELSSEEPPVAESKPEPFTWPTPVTEPAAFAGNENQNPADEMSWPAPAETMGDLSATMSAEIPAALQSPEPIEWPDSAKKVFEEFEEFEELDSAEENLPAAVSQPEAIAWPEVKEEVPNWPSPDSDLADISTENAVPEPLAPAFSWPEPVMELPPVSVLEPEINDLSAETFAPSDEPAADSAPAATEMVAPPVMPATFDPVNLINEPGEVSQDLDQPAPWGDSDDHVQAKSPAEPTVPLIGQWQDEEDSEPAESPQNAETGTSQTWGLPSTWMSEPSASVVEPADLDDRWVSAEEESAAEVEPVPAAPAAPTIDPEKEIEKSLERLFTLNRSFRWKKVGELLQELGLVSEADLNEALKNQKDTKRPLGKTLVEMGIISDRLLLKVLAAQKDVIPWYFDDALEPDLLSLLEPEFCLRCQVLPVRQHGTTLTLVMRNPSDVDTIDFVQHTTGLRVEPALGEEETLAKKIEEGYSRDARSHRAHVDALVQEAFKSSDIRISNIEESKSATAIEEETRPVTAIVQKLIAEAIKMRASDIHMEPTMHDLQVRYRIDGRLHKVNSVPKEIQPMIAARVKIMAELDPVEWRIPQDGRISFEHDRRVVDLRVSVLPSFYGSRIVMRLLDRSAGVKSLDDIGFSSNNLSIFKTLIKRPYGLFLVTGPTGSGKTTSLYAALNEVKDEETNIITCEDPVEYNLDGISQSQVNSKIGLTFAAQLRSILRQDPDVVLVGEIRDHETAETAIRASMTGHLVFSTLHCNDAPSAIPRLLDMNIDPFLLSTSLIGVMGQRLIRRICPDCGTAYTPTQDETTILERTFGLVGVDKLYKGTGCVKCAHTGFKGRFAVHEIMPVTQEISSYIADRAPTEKLAEISRFYGYRTMQEDTLERVLAGQTTLKEAQRLLAFDDIPRIEPGSKKK